MAFGEHWEWRGFGCLGKNLHDIVRSLPRLFPRPQKVTDRYLCVVDCPLNVKLRYGDFKIKRLLETHPSGIERWLEDPAENYSFPLAPSVVEDVATQFGIALTALVSEPIASSEELLELLSRSTSGIRVIHVEKLRWQYRLPEPEGVVVELAEIRKPEQVMSLALEDPERARVRQAMKQLQLPGPLRKLNYLEAVEIWSRGGRVAE